MIESTSMMSRNFVSHDVNESKYSKAREAAANARGQMSNRQNSILAAGIAACATCDTLAERILEGKKAARRMGMDMQQNVSEKSKETLDKLKDKIEERTEELKNSDSEHFNSEHEFNTQPVTNTNNTQKDVQIQTAPIQKTDSQPVTTPQVLPGDIDIEV